MKKVSKGERMCALDNLQDSRFLILHYGKLYLTLGKSDMRLFEIFSHVSRFQNRFQSLNDSQKKGKILSYKKLFFGI